MNWQTILQEFKLYLKLEKKLSSNSIEAYLNDVNKLRLFISDFNQSVTPDMIDSEIIKDFIYQISDYISPHTQARLISGLRTFFNFLILENYLKNNPMQLIESPKLNRKLPDVLSVDEIDRLIGAIDLTTAEGERNRAIIETI
jgi:integrase/recombinase XerD